MGNRQWAMGKRRGGMSQGFRPGLRGVCKCGMRWKQTLTPALWTNLFMGAREREEDPLRLAQFPTGLGTSIVPQKSRGKSYHPSEMGGGTGKQLAPELDGLEARPTEE